MENERQVEFAFQGLYVYATVDYEPETGPTFSCGGTPEFRSAEIDSIELEDAEEFSSYCLLEDFSEGVENMVNAYHKMTGKLLPIVENIILSTWQEEMAEQACIS